MRQLRMAGVALGSALAGAALVVALVTGISTPKASAGGPAVTESMVTTIVGNEVDTSLDALGIASPGLGAWSVNVTYDPAIVSVTNCAEGTGGVCNAAFSSDTVRVAGAHATGLLGDTTLATIRFRCIHVGQSALTISIDTLADSTPGAPADIAASTIDGAVTCQVPPTPAPPTTAPTATSTHVAAAAATATPIVVVAVKAGFGPGSGGGTIGIWLVAGLIGAGIAWLSAGVAGAGLAAVTNSTGERPTTQVQQRFLPRMRRSEGAGHTDQPGTPRGTSQDIPSFRPRKPHDER